MGFIVDNGCKGLPENTNECRYWEHSIDECNSRYPAAPSIAIGEREIRDLLDSPEDFNQLQQTVQLFKAILPELIIQHALFLTGLENVQPKTPA